MHDGGVDSVSNSQKVSRGELTIFLFPGIVGHNPAVTSKSRIVQLLPNSVFKRAELYRFVTSVFKATLDYRFTREKAIVVAHYA